METLAITSAIIKNDNKFLIAKRAATKKYSPNQWEFISGFLDTDESVEEIILREIEEELGVSGKIVKTFKPFSFADAEALWLTMPFAVEIETDKIKINSQDHSELKWVSREELNDYSDLKLFLDNQETSSYLNNL